MTLPVAILDPLPQRLRTEAPVQPVGIGLAVAETAPCILDGGGKRRLNFLLGLDADPDQPFGVLFGQDLSVLRPGPAWDRHRRRPVARR